MNENTLVVVSAYAGDQHQVEDLFPVYRHHGCPILILSPTDAPIIQLSGNPDGVYYQQRGLAEWAGEKALDRHKSFLSLLSSLPYERFLFNDADSCCLSARLPNELWDGSCWSNEVLDTNSAPSKLPKIAMQPPYAFNHDALQKLASVLESPATSYSTVTAEGELPVPTLCPDHLQLQLCHAAEVPHRNFLKGASWETRSELGISEMCRRVREGTIFCHSVKAPDRLHRLMAARMLFIQ